MVKGARKRNTVIKAGFAAAVIQVIALILIEHYGLALRRVPDILLNGIVSSIIVLGVLPVLSIFLIPRLISVYWNWRIFTIRFWSA